MLSCHSLMLLDHWLIGQLFSLMAFHMNRLLPIIWTVAMCHKVHAKHLIRLHACYPKVLAAALACNDLIGHS